MLQQRPDIEIVTMAGGIEGKDSWEQDPAAAVPAGGAVGSSYPVAVPQPRDFIVSGSGRACTAQNLS